MTETMTSPRRAKLDAVCAAAVDVARAALVEATAADTVGDHAGTTADGERLVTHLFECRLEGYRGWRWAVTVTRVSRAKKVTVCETALLPGPDALMPPSWVPWQERLRPGDLGVGDLLPTAPDDDRLEPGYLLSGDPAVDDVAWELGLGRPRVMNRLGRTEAAQRWYNGESGPDTPISRAAPSEARCAGCGFYLPLAGILRQGFGVCGNVFAPDDGRVVSVDHGCGAHSEVLVESSSTVEELTTVYDDGELEPVTTRHPEGSVTDAAPAEPYGHG